MTPKERKLFEHQIAKFSERLKEHIYDNEVTLDATIRETEKHNPPFKDRKTGKHKTIKVGETWGSNWDQAWFHISGKVPSHFKGRIVVARIDVGGEACIFDNKGVPIQGLSIHSFWVIPFLRNRYEITRKSNGKEKVDFWVDATAMQLFGLRLEPDPLPENPKKYGHYDAKVGDLALCTFREDVWHLQQDVAVLDNLMRALPENSVQRAKILHALRQAADNFDESEKTVRRIRKILGNELNRHSSASALTATAVGHAHIDTAWLWPLHETIKKCARTFSTQLQLIDKYPGYVFGCSQAQHYQYTKEHYPALYKKIKKQVKAGRWEIQGGMWLEADCNLISGESMVRQFIHGMNFFLDEFGVRVKNLWLPDVFGYSAAMPQILQRFGIDLMVTQKISWSQFNKFPHHSFIWRGIDGSEIVVHFPPEDTYNSEMKPEGMVRAQENFIEKGVLDEFLVVFGVGDGGGGPTEEIMESALRQRNLEGVPKVTFDAAQNMLERLLENKDLLKTWVGELYLEFHRGTLTTQAHNKKMNRYMELKLRELEFLYSAFLPGQYPKKEFDGMWKTVLLNQFHDIIPGSSINHVYKDSHRDYAELAKKADDLDKAFRKSLGSSRTKQVALVNTLSYPWQRPVALPENWSKNVVVDGEGIELPVQVVGNTPYVLAELGGLQATTIKLGKTPQQAQRSDPAAPASLGKVVFENDLVRYEFNKTGGIKRAYDKTAKRNILTKGKSGNVFSLYEDRPNDWDAWDVDIFYENQFREHAELTGWRLIAEGPLIWQLQLDFKVSNSTISQTVTLAANSKRLEFTTKVNWHERHRMLRVGFWADVVSDQASYEIQYGVVQRPTHRNTSWDMAKFEVCGHRFADLSDDLYGLAILNDCKYGHKIYDNFMELNLLRSPTMPDPEADQGDHEFTYAILPHEGPLHKSEVFSEAAQLNQPAVQLTGVDASTLSMPCSLEGGSVVLEVLKQAEKDRSYIVRLYEARGLNTNCQLSLNKPFKGLMETNLLEENEGTLKTKDGLAKLAFKPFEIRTFRLTR